MIELFTDPYFVVGVVLGAASFAGGAVVGGVVVWWRMTGMKGRSW